ncbi:type II secretion system F family protein [Candidatus Micrarchaeota archaeon]|nr:type II secretion system F family protein [Candidatus Micrarchaeota archaeon]
MDLARTIVERYDKYKRYYQATGLKISFPAFIALMIVVAAVAAVSSFGFIQFLPPHLQQNGSLLAGALFVAIVSMIFGIPMTLRNNRIDAIESNLPDALKHMALVLKAGGTTESALEEVANADYGALSEELKVSLKQLREGKPFDDVLRDTASITGSKLFMRTTGIIVDARKAGAGLADVMNAIAEDARDILRITRERKARTVMHVAFLLISGIFLSPFIFGFTMSIVEFMSGGIAGSGGFGESPLTKNFTLGDCSQPCLLQQDAIMGTFVSIGLTPPETTRSLFEWRLVAMDQLLIIFLAAQSLVTMLAIGLIREGKMAKYAVYFPFVMLIVLAVYLGGKLFSTFIIGT